MIKLGDRVKDKITGFEGIVINNFYIDIEDLESSKIYCLNQYNSYEVRTEGLTKRSYSKWINEKDLINLTNK